MSPEAEIAKMPKQSGFLTVWDQSKFRIQGFILSELRATGDWRSRFRTNWDLDGGLPY